MQLYLDRFSLKENKPALLVLATFIAVVVLGLSSVSTSSKAAAETVSVQADPISTVVQEIQVGANDIAYDAVGDRLYVSVPSSFGLTGNSVIQINPNTLTTAAPIPVGSEPGRMTISDDGKYLYVSLDGAAAVRRIDLATQSAGLQFAPGNDVTSGASIPQTNGPYSARDLKVLPGDSHSVAVVRHISPFSGSHGVALYSDGVKLPADSGSIDLWSTFRIAFASPSVAYAIGLSGALLKFTVNSSGISLVRVTNPFELINTGIGSDIVYGGGFIYTLNGSNSLKINPETPEIAGSFSVPNQIQGIIPDEQTGRLYVLSSGFFGITTSTANIHAFDLATLAPLGSIEISGLRGSLAKRFVRWGPNGLAFNTNANQLFVLRTSLIPSAAPVTLPTPTQPVRITPPAIAATIRQIPLPNDDLIYDPQRAVIYATVPSFAGANGNSVIPINPVTGDLGVPRSIGTNPGILAISPDGKYLWVSIISEQKVRRLNLQSNSVDVEFGIESTNPDLGFVLVSDMAVFPDDMESVVVARVNPQLPSLSPGMLVYKNSTVSRVSFRGDHHFIETGDEPGVFYGMATQALGTFNYARHQFGKPSFLSPNFTVDYICNNMLGGFAGNFKWDNGLLFDRFGRVGNPKRVELTGTFDVTDSLSRPTVLPDTNASHAYFLSGLPSSIGSTWTLKVFDTRTYLHIGSVQIPGVIGDAGSLIRWGADGIAFGTGGNQIFLIQSSFFKPSPELILETSSDQAAATDSVFFTRDAFQILNPADWLNFGADKNRRITLFARNVFLTPNRDPSSIVVQVTDSNNQIFNIGAEDVRKVPNVDLTQIVFRLPDNLAPGTCTISIKVDNLVTNSGKLRITQ